MIELAKQDTDYFAPLYDAYHRPIFLFVFKRVADYDIAADITSHIFIKAMVNIKKYQFKGVPFLSWLYRIAVNEVNMYFRKQKKNTQVPLSETEVNSVIVDLGEDLSNDEKNKKLLVDVLNEIDEKDTQLIELRFFEKMQFQEIGEIYNISKDNAKVRVYRILKKMKKLMVEKGAETK